MRPMDIDFPGIWRALTDHFQLGEYSLHGPDHWRRVEHNGIELTGETGADLLVVRLFAVFHDSCRTNESFDPEHGQRAAELALQTHGELFELQDHQLEFLCEACAGHHLGETTDGITVGTCWDADRLDLCRVTITPAADFMSTAAGRRRAERFFDPTAW